MTIYEAVKILDEYIYDEDYQETDKLPDAVKLSIEALKQVIAHPIVVEHHLRALLPGETTD